MQELISKNSNFYGSYSYEKAILKNKFYFSCVCKRFFVPLQGILNK